MFLVKLFQCSLSSCLDYAMCYLHTYRWNANLRTDYYSFRSKVSLYYRATVSTRDDIHHRYGKRALYTVSTIRRFQHS